MIQEVAYNSLLLRQRRELHRAVGAAIEELYPERLAEHYEELAYHFTQGEVWTKAMAYSTLAGDRAAEAFANAEARAHYARTLQAAAQVTPSVEPGTVARLHAKHGAVLMVLAEHGEAEAEYHRALDLTRQTADRQGEIDILVGLSEVYRRDHREAPAIAAIEQGLALTQGHPDQAWTYTTQSLELATQTDSRKHVVRAQRLQGDILAASGRLAEAAQALVTSVRLAEQIQTLREVWLGQAALGKVLTRLGRDKEAEAQLTQATQTIEAIAATLHTPRLRHSFLSAGPVLEIYAVLGHRPPPKDEEGG